MRIASFNSLPKDARRLIIYYAIAQPGIIGFVIFNAYLFLLGYSPMYVGSVVSGASLLTAILLPILGYLSDKKINAKYYMITTEALIGAAFIIFGLARNGLWIFAGNVIFSTAMLFTFASNVYEKELYPKDLLEEAYIWHWIVPSAAGILTYLAAFVYFSLIPSVEAARWYYIALGLAAPLFISYIYFALPDMPTYPERERIKIPKGLIGIVLVSILAYLQVSFLYDITLDNIIINYFGYGLSVIVLLSIIDNLFGLSSGFLKAHISKEHFPKMPYIAMLLLSALSFLLFVLHFKGLENIWIFILLYSLLSLAWPLWHMSFKPILQRNIPKKYRGTIFSSIQSINRLVGIPLAFIIGVTITYLGAFSPLLISSILGILTALSLKLLLKD